MSITTHEFLPKFRKGILLICLLLPLPVVTACKALMPAPTPTITPTASITPSPTATLTPTPTFTPTITPTPTEVPTACGLPAVMFILLIGSDTRGNGYNAGLADAIRLVRVDFAEPGVQLLTFQRDLYVEIPGIESHYGITHGKLNQAYLYGNPGFGYYDGPGQGPGLLAETLDHNFGAQVDHYIAVNLLTFSRFVDALGGIDIRLPYVIDGRVPGSRDRNRYFPAGNQHLDGYRTMLLARMRTQGDLKRSEIQNLILQSLVDELLSPSTLRKLPELNKSFSNSIQTDLGPVDVGRLVCLSSMLDKQKIKYLSFPDELFKNTRVQDPVLGYTSIWDADFEVLKTYVEKFEEGTWGMSKWNAIAGRRSHRGNPEISFNRTTTG